MIQIDPALVPFSSHVKELRNIDVLSQPWVRQGLCCPDPARLLPHEAALNQVNALSGHPSPRPPVVRNRGASDGSRDILYTMRRIDSGAGVGEEWQLLAEQPVQHDARGPETG